MTDTPASHATPAPVWKVSPGMVVVDVVRPCTSHSDYWEVRAPGSRHQDGLNAVHVSAFHPLPAVAAEDAGVIAAAVEVERRRAQVVSGDTAMHALYLAALKKLYAAVRARAACVETEETPHPICDNPTRYDRGQCCARTPCTDPSTSPVVAALEKTVAAAGLASLAERKASGSCAPLAGTTSRVLWDALETLRAALTPPEPADPVGELREAANEALVAIESLNEYQGREVVDRHATIRLRNALAALEAR